MIFLYRTIWTSCLLLITTLSSPIFIFVKSEESKQETLHLQIEIEPKEIMYGDCVYVRVTAYNPHAVICCIPNQLSWKIGDVFVQLEDTEHNQPVNWIMEYVDGPRLTEIESLEPLHFKMMLFGALPFPQRRYASLNSSFSTLRNPYFTEDYVNKWQQFASQMSKSNEWILKLDLLPMQVKNMKGERFAFTGASGMAGITIKPRLAEEQKAIDKWFQKHYDFQDVGLSDCFEIRWNASLDEIQEFENILSPGTLKNRVHYAFLVRHLFLTTHSDEQKKQIDNLMNWVASLPELEQHGMIIRMSHLWETYLRLRVSLVLNSCLPEDQSLTRELIWEKHFQNRISEYDHFSQEVVEYFYERFYRELIE